METLQILPFKDFARSVVLPVGSKSITNRALILAAMSEGECVIEGALFSRDTEIMMSCLSALGYDISADKTNCTITIKGGEIKNSTAELFVGNAGTAARFITAFAATKVGGCYTFDSDNAMYERPMKGLFDVLKNQGAVFEFLGEENHFPFKMTTNGLKGGVVDVDASASSQILSALMMASKKALSPMEISCSQTVSKPFVEMTHSMLQQFPTSKYKVEPDATAASYFVMLPVITGGVCCVENFANCVLQGDAKFVEVLEKSGLIKTQKVENDILVFACNEFSNDAIEFDFNDISDTFLTLASASAFLPCKVKITGIAHTRKQETDRVFAMESQLKKLVKNVSSTEDSLEIESFPAFEKCKTRSEICSCLAKNLSQKISIETFEDHRVAMSFAILGCANIGREWLVIENPQCVSKTWREFFDVLAEAKTSSEKFRIVAVDGGAAVGKSSVSTSASSSLGYMHVDTGAHYRNLAFILLENNVVPSDIEGVKNLLKTLKLSTTVVGNDAKILCSGRVLQESDIRCERINANVSLFAAIPEVREFLKAYQRSMADFAKENGFKGIIMEGRDIGSIIFPDANARIFLDADEQTRAARRAKEGISDSIKQRDALDKNRKVAPLVCPEGASRVDTSHMTKDEVVAKSISIILNS